jgi:hypothetical protein
MNLCRACKQDFNSVVLFDRHRVGKHAYTYSEGIAMDPMREDGRRCLSVGEMAELGWRTNDRGRWIDPAEVARARKSLHRSAETAAEQRRLPLSGSSDR